MPHLIEVIDNAISPELCQQWLQAFDESPHLTAGQTGGGVDAAKKRSLDLNVSNRPEFRALLKPVIQATTQGMLQYFSKHPLAMISGLGLKLAHPQTGELVSVTVDNFAEVAQPALPMLMQRLFRVGAINAQRYEKSSGGYPYVHSEVYPDLPDNEALHRVLLFMFYLNDVEVGGETEFYYQQVRISPRAGRMVIAPAYFTHSHCGHVPQSGHKYILTSWILFSRAQQLFQQAPVAGGTHNR
ncbi:MAG TPA: proline hydroxylase [Planctomycetaceae bacterium]|nr:proline hydroxylase [Planctomycetaceae bacterium]